MYANAWTDLMFADDFERTSPALSLIRSECTRKRRSIRSIRESKKATMIKSDQLCSSDS